MTTHIAGHEGVGIVVAGELSPHILSRLIFIYDAYI
jgi:hypothetical protein